MPQATGATEYAVDLGQFADAITTVAACKNAISDDFSQIQSQLMTVVNAWTSPAGQSYDDFQSSLTSTTQQLLDVLEEIISRMQQTYQNYLDAEQANSNNLT